MTSIDPSELHHDDEEATGFALSDTHVASVPRTATCGEVQELFRTRPALPAVAVLDGDKPVGLVQRSQLTNRMMLHLGGALLHRTPVETVMETEPAIVELTAPLEAIIAALMKGGAAALSDGVIFVKDGAFQSLVGAQSILRQLDSLRRNLLTERRLKSDFVASISHELRTPLNAIIGLSDVLAHRRLGENPQAQKKYVEYSEDIRDSGFFLLEMVESLLTVSSEDGPATMLKPDSLLLGEVVESAARPLANAAKLNDVDVELRVEFKGRVSADKRAVTSIVNNILGNAVKFTPPGGRVTLYCAMAGDDRAMIRVLDGGPGFAATEDTDDPALLEAKGLGLGLRITRALLDQMHGELIIRDRPNIGAEVRAYFPIETAKAARNIA